VPECLTGSVNVNDTRQKVNFLTNVVVSSNISTSSYPPQSPPQKRMRHTLLPYSRGELGKLADCNARELARLGWYKFFRDHQTPTSIHPFLHRLPHPAVQYLINLASTGAPAVSMTPPWTLPQKDAAFDRGPHLSASKHYQSFLMEDMYEYVQMGYWTVLPYSALRCHPHLRISPAGVVPQRDRRPRPIMDYSFYQVNQEFIPLAPTQAMQFGQTLQRLLQRLTYCDPVHGPPLLAKIDLADGYYRVPVSATAALQLAVVLPSDTSPTPLLALPLSLPMGWNHSPPFFCAFTEAVTDVANTYMSQNEHPHPLYDNTQLQQPTPSSFHPSAVVFGHNKEPLQYIDVYLDDFILAAQIPRHTSAMHTLLHALDMVFADHPPRKSVVSRKKLLQGDVTFSTEKCILGWNINTATMTLSLPAHRHQKLRDLITRMLQKKRTSSRQWRHMLGVFRSTTPALYGAIHCFSLLQHALTEAKGARLRLSPLIKAVLRDWLLLVDSAHHHPVPIHTLIPGQPTILAAVDASRHGMGGCWVLPPSATNPTSQYFVWRAPFPSHIQQYLVSSANPTGSITNSDLELAALLTGAILAAAHSPTSSPHILIASDNTPAIAWATKGSNTTTKAPAYLLHYLASARRALPFTFTPVFTSGKTNTLADCCSRSFALDDTAFLHHMDQTFPTQPSWTYVRPNKDLLSNMISTLCGKLFAVASQQVANCPTTTHGPSGQTFVSNLIATPNLQTSTTPSRCYNYLPIGTEWAHWLPAVVRLGHEQWRAPFVPWGRRSPHWAAQTLALTSLVA
jgi:hypothetical protein